MCDHVFAVALFVVSHIPVFTHKLAGCYLIINGKTDTYRGVNLEYLLKQTVHSN